MKEAFIPMVSPPSPPPPSPPQPEEVVPEPQPQPEPEPEPQPPPPQEEEEKHLPVLVNNYGIQIVYPTEARRDVLSGKVAYIYIDEKGPTIFKPKHIFTALKLQDEQKKKIEDYSCIGAHQRTFAKRPRYRRRYRELENDEQENDEGRIQAMSSFSGGSSRPRA